jgi:hypothetical protein
MLECEPNDFLFSVKAGAARIQVAPFCGLGFGFTIVLRIFLLALPRHGTEGRKGFGSIHQNHAIVVPAAIDGVKTLPAQEAPGHPGLWLAYSLYIHRDRYLLAACRIKNSKISAISRLRREKAL